MGLETRQAAEDFIKKFDPKTVEEAEGVEVVSTGVVKPPTDEEINETARNVSELAANKSALFGINKIISRIESELKRLREEAGNDRITEEEKKGILFEMKSHEDFLKILNDEAEPFRKKIQEFGAGSTIN